MNTTHIPKSKGQLADELKISGKTLRRWLKKAGIHTGRRSLLTPKELTQFYEVVGGEF